MKEKDPEYVNSHRAYKKRIATRCRICGEQLLLPEEIKNEEDERVSVPISKKLFDEINKIHDITNQEVLDEFVEACVSSFLASKTKNEISISIPSNYYEAIKNELADTKDDKGVKEWIEKDIRICTSSLLYDRREQETDELFKKYGFLSC